jgi:hypothetical protein
MKLFNIFKKKKKDPPVPELKEKIGRNLIKFNAYIQDGKSGSIRLWNNVSLRDTWDTFLKNIRNISDSKKSNKIDSKNNIYNFSKSVPSVPKNLVENYLEISKKQDNENKLVTFKNIPIIPKAQYGKI